jgi:predicted O-methyltransferase YrrM
MISPFLNKSNLNNHIKEMENIKKEAISIMSTKNIFNIIENNSDYDIFIIQDYLDINLLELISLNINEVKSNILFISDLRTSFWSEIKENNISEISEPVDADILHNDSLQMLALHYIKPTYAMLKFHPPLFYESWVKYSTFLKKNSIMYNVVKQVSVNIFNKDEDYLFNEHINKKHYNYKAERILLQPWAPSGSTEARLIISKKTIINKDVVLYSSSEWENKYLIFNITRSYVSIPTYLELITIYTQSHNYKDFKKHGYDSCPDCFIELTILYQYCKKQANIHFKNIWNYIPNTSEQQDLFTNLKKVCDILYNNLPFLIIKFKNSTSSETHLYEKLNSNKKCTLHGHNFSHKENHLFFQIKNNATYPNTKKLYKVIISKYNEPNVKLIKSKHDLQMYENYDEDISNKLIKKIIDNYPPPHTELKGGFNTNLDNILKINYKINLPELETPITNIWERTDIQVNNVLQKMYFEQAVYDKNNKKIKYNSGVGPIEGWHLYNLVKSNQFNKILEVGMAYGTSALFMCQALKENNAPGYLISIDPNQSTQWEGIGRLNIERAGLLKYHRIMETTSDKAMAYLLSSNIDGDAPESFDMVFVDGMHLFDYTLLDIYFAAKLVRLYGVIVIDDIRHKGVAKAIKYINLNYKFLKLIEINVASQTMATYVKIADDTRLWNFHIEF